MNGAIRILLAAALALAGCVGGKTATATPEAEAPSLAELFAAERYGEVQLLAASVIQAPNEGREDVAEARFFRALAWLARDPLGNQERALLELRTVEFEYTDLVWGRLAAHYVGEAARVDALQATLLELAVEQRDLQMRIDELERNLEELHAELATRDAEITKLARERGELLEQLEQARELAATTAVRLRELEDELAALKQIDMQLEP
jgi:septal ring factor EnvC (AmiA/AmiB activator)